MPGPPNASKGLITLGAQLIGTVYCNRSYLFVALCVCVSVTTITRNCVN